MKRLNLLVPTIPLNKLNEGLMDKYDYDQNDYIDNSEQYNRLKELCEQRIEIIKEILNKKLKGVKYNIVCNALENAKPQEKIRLNDEDFIVEILDVEPEQVAYKVDNVNEEIQNNKIVLPEYIDKQLLVKIVDKMNEKTGNEDNLLKVVKEISND